MTRLVSVLWLLVVRAALGGRSSERDRAAFQKGAGKERRPYRQSL